VRGVGLLAGHLGVLLGLSRMLSALGMVALAVLLGSRAMGLRRGFVMLGRLGVRLLCHFFDLSVGRKVPAEAETASMMAVARANGGLTKWHGAADMGTSPLINGTASQARRILAKMAARRSDGAWPHQIMRAIRPTTAIIHAFCADRSPCSRGHSIFKDDTARREISGRARGAP